MAKPATQDHGAIIVCAENPRRRQIRRRLEENGWLPADATALETAIVALTGVVHDQDEAPADRVQFAAELTRAASFSTPPAQPTGRVSLLRRRHECQSPYFIAKNVSDKAADKPHDLLIIHMLTQSRMQEPDPPKELPPPPYPVRTWWWKFKKLVGYPRDITDWDIFTWDDHPPSNREKAFKETRRELRKSPQNILQDALEQLETDHDKRLECIQKSTISLLAVSAYETQRATWWLQFLTWALLILTTVLVLQTWKLISLETGKEDKDSAIDAPAHHGKNNGKDSDAHNENKNLPVSSSPIIKPINEGTVPSKG